ncbi:MAG: hypothetical protein WAU24_15130 [Chitinophagaceae bacterium]
MNYIYIKKIFNTQQSSSTATRINLRELETQKIIDKKSCAIVGYMQGHSPGTY